MPLDALPPFNFMAHVLDSTTLRVVFEVPVDESALSPGAYLLLPILGVPQIFIPSAVLVEFFDGDMTSVAVTLSAPLTWSAVYSLQLQNISSLDGRTPSTSTYNFTATVPDPPRAIGAFLSTRSCLDIVFDKSVRDTSAVAATAQIFPTEPLMPPSILVPVISVPDIPVTNLRFRIQSDLATGSKFLIQYQQITDSSFNTSDGEILLDVRLPYPPPWSYINISTPAVTFAHIDRVIPAEYRTYVNIFFNCPMLAADIVDVSNWTVMKEGVHLSGATPPVTAPDPFDDASLVAICVDLKFKFNSHLTIPGVHFADAGAPPSVMSVIGLLNNLLEKFNSHAVAVPSHSFPDRDDIVNLGPAFTIQQATILASTLKSRFNTHLNALHGVIPYHFVSDTEDAVVSPDPSDSSDLRAAAIIADELRTRLLMHELGIWHSYPDPNNIPSASYSHSECIFPSVATASEAVAFLNELQSKYTAHLIAKSLHLYQDDVNVLSQQVVTTTVAALPVATTLKSLFNGHILQDFSTEVDSIIPFADQDSAVPVNDGFTYMVRLKLKSAAFIPKYTITASLRSADLLNVIFGFTTAPFDTIEFMSTLPRKQSVTIRTSADLALPRTEDVSITKSDGLPVRVTDIFIESSPQTIQGLVEELMHVFRIHLSEDGQTVPVHQSIDTLDNFDDSHIPSMNDESIIAAVNFLKDVYNKHVSNNGGPYHIFQVSADIVSEPDATDFKSAVILASVLNIALIAHRGNLSSHYDKGPRLQFAKVHDILVVHYDGLMDSANYTLIADLKVVPNDPYSSSAPILRKVKIPFSGISDSPVIAAAIPEPGAGRGAPTDRLVQDQLDIFFSKPMREEFVAPAQLIFTGPPGLLVGNSSWEGSRFLRVQVRGMKDSVTYGLDVDSLVDSFGNSIG